MARSPDSSNASLPATAQQLQRARAGGQVATSSALMAALVLLAGALTVAAVASDMSRQLAQVLASALTDASTHTGQAGQADDTAMAWFSPAAIAGALWRACGPVLVVCLVVGWLAGLVQTGFLWTGAAVSPRLQRLRWRSLLAQRGGRVAVEGVRIACGVTAIGVLLAFLLTDRVDGLLGLGAVPVATALTTVGQLGQTWLLGAAFSLVCLGLLDWLWRRHAHRQDLRMTPDQARRERREHQGAPELRAARRQRLGAGQGRGGARSGQVWRLLVQGQRGVALLAYAPHLTDAPWLALVGHGAQAEAVLRTARAHGLREVVSPSLGDALSQLPAGATVPPALQPPVAALLAGHPGGWR